MLFTWSESCKSCITRVTGRVRCMSQTCEICGLRTRCSEDRSFTKKRWFRLQLGRLSKLQPTYNLQKDSLGCRVYGKSYACSKIDLFDG